MFFFYMNCQGKALGEGGSQVEMIIVNDLDDKRDFHDSVTLLFLNFNGM